MRAVVNISLPKELNKEIEHLVRERNYASKSELIRELLRFHVEDELVREIEESELEIHAGKGKTLRSLKDLR